MPGLCRAAPVFSSALAYADIRPEGNRLARFGRHAAPGAFGRPRGGEARRSGERRRLPGRPALFRLCGNGYGDVERMVPAVDRVGKGQIGGVKPRSMAQQQPGQAGPPKLAK